MHRRLKEIQLGLFACAKFGIDSEDKRDVLAGDVAAAEPDGDGDIETGKSAQDCIFEQIGGRAGRFTFEHFAKDDAGDSIQLASFAQLPEHAVDLVRLRCQVFEEEELAFSGWLPGRAEQGNENTEAAAVKRATRGTGFQSAQAFGGPESVCRARKR